MKNIKFILGIIVGIIISGSIVYAVTISSSDITYDNSKSHLKDSNNNDVDNVKDAIDALYTKANNSSGSSSDSICMFLSNKYGAKGQIGAKYVCNLGDDIARNFYVLNVDGDLVKLIMDTNLTDTIGIPRPSYAVAINYLKNGGAAYSTVSKWTNVLDVDLPSAQDIADAAGITNWNVTTAVQNDWSYFGDNSQNVPSNRGDYTWLYDYTRGCVGYGSCAIEYSSSDSGKAYGYWTKDVVSNDSSRSWRVSCYGTLASNSAADDPGNGVRPVITINRSQLN